MMMQACDAKVSAEIVPFRIGVARWSIIPKAFLDPTHGSKL
jgi:hypothetical protein